MQLQTDYRTAAIFQSISQSPVQQIEATVSLKCHFQKTGQSHREKKPWWVKWTMTKLQRAAQRLKQTSRRWPENSISPELHTKMTLKGRSSTFKSDLAFFVYRWITGTCPLIAAHIYQYICHTMLQTNLHLLGLLFYQMIYQQQLIKAWTWATKTRLQRQIQVSIFLHTSLYFHFQVFLNTKDFRTKANESLFLEY